MALKQLLTNQTVNTTGTQDEFISTGGSGLLTIWGTFDGATVTPEVTQDASAEGWLAVRDSVGADLAITTAVNDELIKVLKSGYKLRLSVTNAGASTDLNGKYKT